ncbi:Uncharacterized protein FWK35_00021852 [Aphis craccivora]|uniref:Uncharacterized protein n=1 Tax=Aphis craccivora TaxID=307492 RepID=A0A6G0Y921_APHCR|nr:Uncharacterized protein FWK35_00021852 [Aphis craccivora]
MTINSGQSDECIDFTMMCGFFFCVTTFWSSKSASIFKLSPVSDRKVNFKFLRNLPKMRKFAILKLKNHKKIFHNDNDLSSNDFKYLFISRRYLKILPCR